MLSRVAERVYWTARYLERAENTARLIDAYDKLMFDLPRAVNLSWYHLVNINSADDFFEKRFKSKSEKNVIKFILSDKSNPNSIVSSIKMIRENLRTTRDVVPADIWKIINELNIFLEENITQGVNRSKRFQFLDELIKRFQQIHGLIYGTMPHHSAWYFMRLGRNVERADMITRQLDAGVSALLYTAKDEAAVNRKQIIWGSVLRALSADQPYRRSTRSAVTGSEVVRYLIKDPDFPRTITHCYLSVEDSASHLPRSEAVTKEIRKYQKHLSSPLNFDNLDERLRDYLNDLQLHLASIHHAIQKNWFSNH